MILFVLVHSYESYSKCYQIENEEIKSRQKESETQNTQYNSDKWNFFHIDLSSLTHWFLKRNTTKYSVVLNWV